MGAHGITGKSCDLPESSCLKYYGWTHANDPEKLFDALNINAITKIKIKEGPYEREINIAVLLLLIGLIVATFFIARQKVRRYFEESGAVVVKIVYDPNLLRDGIDLTYTTPTMPALSSQPLQKLASIRS